MFVYMCLESAMACGSESLTVFELGGRTPRGTGDYERERERDWESEWGKDRESGREWMVWMKPWRVTVARKRTRERKWRSAPIPFAAREDLPSHSDTYTQHTHTHTINTYTLMHISLDNSFSSTAPSPATYCMFALTSSFTLVVVVVVCVCWSYATLCQPWGQPRLGEYYVCVIILDCTCVHF